jgi:hypothetical protein
MDTREVLDFLVSNWGIYATDVLYQTSPTKKLLPAPEDYVYVYSLHKVEDPVYMEIDTVSSFFRIFEFKRYGMQEPVGYAFIPTWKKDVRVRFTPLAVVATTPEATKERVANAQIAIILDTPTVQLLLFSGCGAEVITDLGHKLGVFMEDM